MARPKTVTTVSTDSTEIKDEVGTVEVKNTDKVETVKQTEKKEETRKNKKEEVFSDEDTVFIKNEKYINKSVIGLNGPISFNEEGICEMKGIDAKRFLTIPGYIYVKKG